MSKVIFAAVAALTIASSALFSGCSTLAGWAASTTWQSAAGPSRSQVNDLEDVTEKTGIQVVDVDESISRKLLENQRKSLFSEAFGADAKPGLVIGAGDVVGVSIWEAPPGTLFSGGSAGAVTASTGLTTAAATSQATAFPDQMVNAAGTINIPFAGNVPVVGRTSQQVEAEIVRRLQGKANQPQVMVHVSQNNTSAVTVVGDVTTNLRMPLTSRGERLLDALAAAGGMSQARQTTINTSVNRASVQLTRGEHVEMMPLDAVIRDPRQNILLQPGDVVTALFQSQSFTVLGATGKNDEVSFEAQGISLAQALARVSGLIDSRSDPYGVFIFRFEPVKALPWRSPPAMTPEGKVPVVYRVNLRDPSSLFAAQSFPMQNKDILYVANAPGAELQKFMNLVMSAIYPLISLIRYAPI
jgi:polysaccharide export outer membrane protein